MDVNPNQTGGGGGGGGTHILFLIGPPPASKVVQANEGTGEELISMNNHTTPKSWATFHIMSPCKYLSGSPHLAPMGRRYEASAAEQCGTQ